MTIPEARKLIQDWYAPQPKTKEFMMERRKDPLLGRVYETPIGRIRPFGLITEKNRNGVQNEAGNFPIQATASDLTVWSICRLVEEFDKMNEELGFEAVRLVNTVHDSIIAEVWANEDIIKRTRDTFKRIMESAGKILLNTDVPFVADAEIGHRWGSLYDFTIEESGNIIVHKKTGDISFKELLQERTS
ncbi:DNA polymerase family A [Weizmannia phage Youna2]